MKKTFLQIVILTLVLGSCNNPKSNLRVEKVNADTLLESIDNYLNRKIEIEGYIVHVCGVDGMKMKLKTVNEEIIKIVPLDSNLRFDGSFYKQNICVQGIITESKLEKHRIDSLENEKTLLCHIDNTPCKDKEWVENQIRKGVSDSLARRDIQRLNNKMRDTGKDYVSIYTVIAERIIINEE